MQGAEYALNTHYRFLVIVLIRNVTQHNLEKTYVLAADMNKMKCL